MLRILPCKHCPSGHATTADGRPYWLRAFPERLGGHPYLYVCRQCRRVSEITLPDFLRLPQAKLEEL
jgi:hypothetical protein